MLLQLRFTEVPAARLLLRGEEEESDAPVVPCAPVAERRRLQHVHLGTPGDIYIYRERETDRQTDRQRQRDRQRETERQTQRETETVTERQRQGETERAKERLLRMRGPCVCVDYHAAYNIGTACVVTTHQVV